VIQIWDGLVLHLNIPGQEFPFGIQLHASPIQCGSPGRVGGPLRFPRDLPIRSAGRF
jgi:hypothetical protein